MNTNRLIQRTRTQKGARTRAQMYTYIYTYMHTSHSKLPIVFFLYFLAPEEFKQNITASSINSTHALIRWLPFPDNLWNTGNNNSRGYKIFIEEISFPKFWNDSAIDLFATHPSGEIVVGPLEEDRMYGIQIAAMNNRGDGVKSKKICMRMNEGGLY